MKVSLFEKVARLCDIRSLAEVCRMTAVENLWKSSEILNWTSKLLFALALFNLTLFIISASDPLIVQDAWYFLDTFIRNALSGHLTAHDFFIKRGPLDHAQPLRKMILWVELRYFHLDFRIEALAGLISAAGCALILKRLMATPDGIPRSEGSALLLWIVGMLGIVNLNSTYVWSWPLVASAFTTYVILFAVIVIVWRAATEGGSFHAFAAVFSIFALDIAADDTALIATVAIFLALFWLIIKKRNHVKEIVLSLTVLVAVFLIARFIYHLMEPNIPVSDVAIEERLHELVPRFIRGGWWQWIYIPLSSGVIVKEHLARMFGIHAVLAQSIIGAILMLAHVWFWYRAVTGPADRASFAAIIFMLMFYAFVAGILVGRVSQFGNLYLNSPRYALIYSFGWIALILMLTSRLSDARASRLSGAAWASILTILMLSLQVNYVFAAWDKAPYMRKYYVKMAIQIVRMNKHPEVTPAHCAPELPICNYSVEQRKDLTGLLARNHLNIFSPTFRRWNRFEIQGLE